MFVVAHSAHWLLEAGPLLVVPVVLLVYWLRAERDRRRGRGDNRADQRPSPRPGTRPSGPVARERPPHA